jgi:hypothetical protein
MPGYTPEGQRFWAARYPCLSAGRPPFPGDRLAQRRRDFFAEEPDLPRVVARDDERAEAVLERQR